MTCCGSLRDITTQDEKVTHFICEGCGRIGTPSEFPDPPEPAQEPEPEPSPIERMRRWLANKI